MQSLDLVGAKLIDLQSFGVAGDHLSFKRIFVGDQFSIAHSGISSGIPLHAHNEYVVGYYFKGRSRCRIHSVGFVDFCPGNVSLLNPGDAHEDSETSYQRDYLTVNMQKGFFEKALAGTEILSRTPPCFCLPKLEDDKHLRRIFQTIGQESDGTFLGRDLILTSLVTELSVHLMRRFGGLSTDAGQFDAKRSVARWRVRRAIEYLRDNCNLKFDLDRISSDVGLSRYHFIRVFEQGTGFTPHVYLLLMRVERGKEMLSSTTRPICEISLELGFADQSHFTNVFKRFTGISPNVYRQMTK